MQASLQACIGQFLRAQGKQQAHAQTFKRAWCMLKGGVLFFLLLFFFFKETSKLSPKLVIEFTFSQNCKF